MELFQAISMPRMTASGLGCVKTFWRGRTPASTNSRIPPGRC